MRKLHLVIGLAATLEIGCGNYSDKKPSQENVVAPAPQLQNETLEGTIQSIKRKLLSEYIPQVVLKEDGYVKYVTSLRPFPRFFQEEAENADQCDEEKVQKKYQDKHNRSSDNCLITPDYSGVTNGLIRQDIILANCQYKEDKEKYTRQMLEVIDHYRACKSADGIGSVYAYLTSRESNEKKRNWYYDQAIDYFEKAGRFEEIIRITTPKKLIPLRDKYFQSGDWLAAGKIDWYKNKKTSAVELITDSQEFRDIVEQTARYISEKFRLPGLSHLRLQWSKLKIPFSKYVIKELCKKDQACLGELDTPDFPNE